MIYNGQSMYGVDKYNVSDRKTAPGRTRTKQNSFIAPKRLFWNLESRDHTVPECNHPKNIEEIADRNFEFYLNK